MRAGIQDPLPLIILAREHGLISTRQAVETSRCYRQAPSKEGQSFDLMKFWRERGWVSPQDFLWLCEQAKQLAQKRQQKTPTETFLFGEEERQQSPSMLRFLRKPGARESSILPPPSRENLFEVSLDQMVETDEGPTTVAALPLEKPRKELQPRISRGKSAFSSEREPSAITEEEIVAILGAAPPSEVVLFMLHEDFEESPTTVAVLPASDSLELPMLSESEDDFGESTDVSQRRVVVEERYIEDDEEPPTVVAAVPSGKKKPVDVVMNPLLDADDTMNSQQSPFAERTSTPKQDLATPQHEASYVHRQRAQQLLHRLQQQSALLQKLQTERDALTTEPWATLSQKQELWRKDEDVQTAQTLVDGLFEETIRACLLALSWSPEQTELSSSLAKLYWERFLESERRGLRKAQRAQLNALLQYDDGTYVRQARARQCFRLKTEPSGAEVTIFHYEEEQKRLLPVHFEDAGHTPVELELPPGSYLAEIKKDGYSDVSLPFFLQRDTPCEAHVRLYSPEQTGDGFVLISGATSSLRPSSESPPIEDFFLSKTLLTFREYLAFLNHIYLQNPQQANASCPRWGEHVYATFSEQDGYLPCCSPLCSEVSLEEELELPVFGVSLSDAQTYIQWRSQRDGRLYALPTEAQWEKATGAFDARLYPWGNSFDSQFCHMGLSFPPNQMFPRTAKLFEVDRSPYGVRQLAGSLKEWVAPSFGSLCGTFSLYGLTRGGHWAALQPYECQISHRSYQPFGERSPFVGFRLASLASSI